MQEISLAVGSLKRFQRAWLGHLEAWREQGAGLKAYAVSHGLSVSSLYTAKRTLTRRGAFGAKSSANLYSLIETARADRLDPYAYLRHVFTELPKADTIEAIGAPLPVNIDPTVLVSTAA